ncbi:hypothetical protein WH47_11889 [Habropoda laboriosa]|uniref:Uncharacterized protein n=1 Tax=Habropoda laboriosa TaxID=597456 RepID=A0A0L7QLE6_9HYME|nr:hypothetical protein WH47_11889 [Habropoda laboriosa]
MGKFSRGSRGTTAPRRSRTVSRLQGYPVSRASEPRELPYGAYPMPRTRKDRQGLPVVNGLLLRLFLSTGFTDPFVSLSSQKIAPASEEAEFVTVPRITPLVAIEMLRTDLKRSVHREDDDRCVAVALDGATGAAAAAGTVVGFILKGRLDAAGSPMLRETGSATGDGTENFHPAHTLRLLYACSPPLLSVPRTPLSRNGPSGGGVSRDPRIQALKDISAQKSRGQSPGVQGSMDPRIWESNDPKILESRRSRTSASRNLGITWDPRVQALKDISTQKSRDQSPGVQGSMDPRIWESVNPSILESRRPRPLGIPESKNLRISSSRSPTS